MTDRIESADSPSRETHLWRDLTISGAGPVLLAIAAVYFSKDITALTPEAPLKEHSILTPSQQSARDAEHRQLAASIVADNAGTWRELFARTSQPYTPPELALFNGTVTSACGYPQVSTGPLYCAQENKVYVDLSFLNQLQEYFPAGNDFASAYVIAHEMAHHAQALQGISAKVDAAQQRGRKSLAKSLSMRLELQAECYAGVWMRRSAESRPVFTAVDVTRSMEAATLVSEERMQSAAVGVVAHDAFTHGTVEQRAHWFDKGLTTGDLAVCDTFAARKP